MYNSFPISHNYYLTQELGIITINSIYICDSTPRKIFLGFLYGYKMILQIVAILFAFSIRKVKVKDLGNSKYFGAAIYVTSFVLAVTFVATYFLNDSINGIAALTCTGFMVGTSVILILVFVPLVSITKAIISNLIVSQAISHAILLRHALNNGRQTCIFDVAVSLAAPRSCGNRKRIHLLHFCMDCRVLIVKVKGH